MIDREAEKPIEDSTLTNTNKRMMTMEKILEAKLAIVQFLRYIEVDLADNFQETLPDPILEYNEVRGDIWKFRTQYGSFEVTRKNPRVTIFIRNDSIPGENSRPPKPEGYAEEQALEVAKTIVRKMIPNFDQRKTSKKQGLEGVAWQRHSP
jgi:hypothetical protein